MLTRRQLLVLSPAERRPHLKRSVDEFFAKEESEMSDHCESTELKVTIQENGIIRDASDGYLIGCLTDKLSYQDITRRSSQQQSEKTFEGEGVIPEGYKPGAPTVKCTPFSDRE